MENTKPKHLEKYILELADNMAAAASMFNAHGYDTFILARDQLKKVLSENVGESNYRDQ